MNLNAFLHSKRVKQSSSAQDESSTIKVEHVLFSEEVQIQFPLKNQISFWCVKSVITESSQSCCLKAIQLQ